MTEERTEQATPRRREEARKRGEVARSPELAGAGALLGALLAMRLCWDGIARAAVEVAQWAMRDCAQWEPTVECAVGLLRCAIGHAARMAGPAAVGACIAAVAVNLGQTGFLISGHPLTFQWNRLSLPQGVRRLFSMRSYVSVLRSLVKLVAVVLVTYIFLRHRWTVVLGMAQGTATAAGGTLGLLTWGLIVRVAGALLVIALADYLYQRRDHEKKLRMTRHELREEHKRTEGDPLVRSRIREQQRAVARHRMFQAVKKAKVVIVNPTDLAVALRYETGRTPSPVVVAKGRRLMAERIRREAERHGVAIVHNRELARALYRSVPVGRQIPPELYQAVAEILAFVYREFGANL